MRLSALPLALAVAAAVAAPTLPSSNAATVGGPDPLRNRQFGLTQIDARGAWLAGTSGQGVTIAVVDSGVDRGHSELAGRLLPGATFLGCGPTSCGDGGWLSGPAARRGERSPHGMHVAGIAAAAKDNRVGTAGVAYAARVLPVKVLDQQGGSTTDIARGIRFATARGAKVINLSLGLPPGVSQGFSITGVTKPITDAVRDASRRGVLVVAAAGNEAAPLCDSPAFETGALCVTATDRRQLPAAYSNGALKPDLLSVAAPGGSALGCGEDVVSSLPRGYDVQDPCRDGVSFGELAGTSMAAPHVAGVAALLFQQGRNRQQVLDALLTTARTPGVGRGVFTERYGRGIVDASAAVRSRR